MANQPRSVVIVGGSLAGLMHGLYLKRHGSDVVILEQDPNAIRSSHQAGIAFGAAVEELLRKYDDTGIQNCSPSVSTRFAYRKRAHFLELNIIRHLTSWGLLYRILRANFDGLASTPVPNPPPPRSGDGRAEYRSGKRVTKLQCESSGPVTVSYVDQEGRGESITADLVIGADGLHSTVRSLLGVPTTKEYSGYVAWRGTVLEKDVPPETAQYFSERTCLGFLKNTYLVCYAIPPDNGTFTPQTRLLNWVWYSRAPASSALLRDLLTSTTGHTHSNTVPAGQVQPALWRAHLAASLPAMAAPYAQLLSATSPEAVFVTKVNDALCERGVFEGGRVVLVGDARATFRPHFAVATEQAARHCLALGKVLVGEDRDGEGEKAGSAMTMTMMEREAAEYAERVWLGSRVMGVFWVGGWWEFCRVLWAYLAWGFRNWLGRVAAMGRGG